MNAKTGSANDALIFRFARNYDGMEIFGEDANQSPADCATLDPVDEIVRDSGKTYGEADGRHKRD